LNEWPEERANRRGGCVCRVLTQEIGNMVGCNLSVIAERKKRVR